MRYLGKQPKVSGDRVSGGKIENFSSTGIDDNSTQTNITVDDADIVINVSDEVSITSDIGTIVNTTSTSLTSPNIDVNVSDVADIGDGALHLDRTSYAQERLGVFTSSPEAELHVVGDNMILECVDDGALPGPTVYMRRNSASPADGDLLGRVLYTGFNSAQEEIEYATIEAKARVTTDGSEAGEVDINVYSGGSQVNIAKLRDDLVIFNDGQIDMDFVVRGQTDSQLLYANTGTSRLGIGTENPEEKVHIVGDVKIDGTITFSNQASGAGSVEFTIQDEINSGDDAYAAVVFKDSTALNVGQVAVSGGKLHITSQHTDDGSSGIHFGIGYTDDEGEDYEYMMMLEEESAETTISSANTNISFDNTTGKILSGTSGFFTSNYAVGDIVLIEGASNSANNRSWRIESFADTGGSVVVIDRRGNKPTTESAGASITVKKHTNMVMVPNTVNHYTWTAPQSDNSQRVASTAYVRTAVSDLIDSSPGALDTLNELAAAINDDANFATTVTNSIATKLSLAGGTMTGFITLHTDPTSGSHAATKSYVDTGLNNVTSRDFNNLTATGLSNLEEYVEDYASGMITSASHSGLSVSYDDNANTLTFNVNDPLLTVNANTGDVRGSGSATMTDLGSTSINFGLTLQDDVILARHIDTEDGTNNIINGLPELASEESFQNDDYIIFADDSAGGALRKVRKGKAIPPAFTEDLGYFAIAMS